MNKCNKLIFKKITIRICGWVLDKGKISDSADPSLTKVSQPPLTKEGLSFK